MYTIYNIMYLCASSINNECRLKLVITLVLDTLNTHQELMGESNLPFEES